MGERRFIKKRKLRFDSKKFETKTMGGRIRFWRLSSGISQEVLAEEMNVSKQTISNYENNISEVDASKLAEMAKIFEIEVGWLFADQFSKMFDEFNNEVIRELDDKEMCSIYQALSADLQSVAIEQMRLLLTFYNRQKKH